MSLRIDSTQKSAWYVISTMHGLAVNIISITLLRSSCRGHWLDQPGGARRGLRRENQQTWPLILTLPSRTGVSVSLSPPYQSTTHWGGLKPQKCIFSQFQKAEVQDHRVILPGLFLLRPVSLADIWASSPCEFTSSPVSMYLCSNPLFLWGH